MIRSFVITAIRSFRRSRVSSVINVTGLAAGLSASIIILLYVQSEVSTDKFNENYDQIYRLEYGDFFVSGTAQAILLKDAFPEVAQTLRVDYRHDPLVVDGDNSFRFDSFIFADSTLFDVFTFRFISGNPATALHLPFSLVLTESEAMRIYGNEDPLGKMLRLNNREYTITAVIGDMKNFHLSISAIGSFSSLPYLENDDNHDRHLFSYMNFPTYFLLHKDVDAANLARKFEEFFDNRFPDLRSFPITLRPLNSIYFNTDLNDSPPTRHGNRSMLNTLIAVAFFIMLIAIVNFINLATANSTVRAKEIGVRKLLGAGRRKLISQFLLESVIMSLFALLIAVVIVEIMLPTVNRLLESDLSIGIFQSPVYFLVFTAGAVVIGLVAGLYPAFYLSSRKSGSIIRNVKLAGTGALQFRRFLIVIQFAISIILIVATMVVRNQVNYMKNFDPGFDKEDVLIVRLNSDLYQNKDVFRDNLIRHPEIKAVSLSNNLPGYVTWFNTWVLENEQKPHKFLPVDPDYLEMMGISLVDGRNFDWNRSSDQKNAFILNEEAVRFFGFKDPVGNEYMIGGGEPVRIIGVVENFHFRPLQEEIGPLVLGWQPRNLSVANIRIKGENREKTIGFIGNLWNELSPGTPFEFRFLDDEMDKLYNAENRMSRLFSYFAILAVIIASMGLYGLSTFIAGQRAKEIGIRKVLGSNINQIIMLLISEFSRWVVIANVIAWPVAYYIAKIWLENFPYRDEPGLIIFAGAGFFTLLIAVITVGGEAWRSANVNPSVTLKNE